MVVCCCSAGGRVLLVRLVPWCGGGGGVWWWSTVTVLLDAGVSWRAGWSGGMGCRAGRTVCPANLSAGSGASSVNSALTAVGADSGGARGCRFPPWRRCREAPLSPAWRSWARRVKTLASVFRSGQRRRSSPFPPWRRCLGRSPFVVCEVRSPMVCLVDPVWGWCGVGAGDRE